MCVDEDVFVEFCVCFVSVFGDVVSDSEDEIVNDVYVKWWCVSVVLGMGYVLEGKVKSVDVSLVNKNEKMFVLMSWGVMLRYRYLMLDLLTFVSNAKKDAKLDTKNERNVVVEVVDLWGCLSVMFFECRKK